QIIILKPTQPTQVVPEKQENKKPFLQKNQSLPDRSTGNVPGNQLAENDKFNSLSPNNLNQVSKQDVQVDPNTGERRKNVRTENEYSSLSSRAPDNTSKNNNTNSKRITFLNVDDGKDLSRFVTVKSNDFVRGAFGGIRNLELTVYNDSKY